MHACDNCLTEFIKQELKLKLNLFKDNGDIGCARLLPLCLHSAQIDKSDQSDQSDQIDQIDQSDQSDQSDKIL